MKQNVAQKLIESHLLEGKARVGEEIGIRIDQTLTQDATGTMVMLELEAMDIDHAKTDVSVQYVDHNILQNDFKNAEDHLFLRSACKRFGLWFSRPGNGVSHPVHMERFGIPGKTLLGSDSHTCAAGSMGMLAIGAGGLEVALAIAGEPFHFIMPKIWGVKLTGTLAPWVSAKDVILEMLRRHDVDGGVGKIIEYYGPGLQELTAMDRHVIANMGAELGATATVFPSDGVVRTFLESQRRGDAFKELLPDPGCGYDLHDEINLSQLEPLIALPSSPGKVVPVREVAGEKVYQVMIGSSANPGFRDFAIAAEMVKGRQAHDRVSFDINPTSRQILENLSRSGHLEMLIRSGARIHQAGCNGCIGMGQAPANGRASLRTVPRNFPGRSGTKEDSVYLCSPETAAASALTGQITDPRTLGIAYPRVGEPSPLVVDADAVLPPPKKGEKRTDLDKGSNIKPLPLFDALPENLEGPALIKLGDNVSTDEIMPAGSKVLPFRSNIPKISEFVFDQVDESYPARTKPYQKSGHFIIAGKNYGQGSSREHAAIAPRYLGVVAVLARSFARIHRANLANFGIVPLAIEEADLKRIQVGDLLSLPNVRKEIEKGQKVVVKNITQGYSFEATAQVSDRDRHSLLEGGLIARFRKKKK